MQVFKWEEGADMEKQPLISIIIPVYNAQQYLDECMTSVLHQTYTNLEIILVNDGSKDKSPKMCDEYAMKDARVQVIHKKNGGLISAWIAGVEKSEGEYLIFLDSDDWIDVSMVDDMVKHTLRCGKEIICGNYIIEKEKKSVPVKQAFTSGIYDRKAIESKLFPCLLGKEQRSIHFSRCMKLISKELIVENIPYCHRELTMGEDLGIMVPAILDAERIVVLEEGYYYHYRFVDASMVHKYNPRMYEKVNLLYDTLEKTICKKIKEEERRVFFLNCLKKEYVFLFFFIMKNELRGPKKDGVKRLQRMLLEAKTDKGLKEASIEINSRANKLLYYIMEHPGRLQIIFGRFVIGIFDRMQ